MSWKLGRSKKSSVSNLRAEDVVTARSTTPTPGNPDGKPSPRTGLFAIRVLWAEGLALPAFATVPPAVQSALSSQQAKLAASVSPSSVTQQRLAKTRGNRDSIQRMQCWWLPYLVMEYEVNQVLITPLGGDLEKPLYMYQAHLYVTNLLKN
jgi:serum/glucocorticoid-regulated kinase 2